MTILLFICLLGLCLAIVFEGIKNSVRIYQFPFLASAVFLGFVILPLLGLLRVNSLPAWGLERYLIMSILSMAAIYWGDKLARKKQIFHSQIKYDQKKWMIASTLLIFVGLGAYLKYRILFQDGFDLVTGSTVAVNFFVVLLRYGFIMAIIYFLRTKNRYALLLIIICGLYYFDRIVLAGRRQIMIEFAFVLLASIWFTRKIMVSRIIITICILLFVVFNFSAGAYRSVVVSRSGERDFSQLRNIDWSENFNNVFSEGSSEVIAGVYYMAGVAHEMAFNIGFDHWNKLVFNYVPAQIVGTEVKNSFLLSVQDPASLAEKYYGYTKNTGSTVTGMVGCFNSLWYLGAIEFFAIAYFMQLLFRHSCLGSIKAQIVYLFMMTMALHTITHGTGWFLSPWIHILTFWIPMILWTRSKEINTVKRNGNDLFC